MDQILHTTPSIHTRLKWSVDMKCSFENSISKWEELILKKYDSPARQETIDLILQCRVVGLFMLANDFESSLGDVSESEVNKMYSQIK